MNKNKARFAAAELFSFLMYAGLHNDCPPATNNMLILHKNFLKLNMKASTYTENLCLKE